MFLETICILHGNIQNREGHAERIQRTAAHFGFNAPVIPDLLSLLPEELRLSTDGLQDDTNELRNIRIKCRIVYHETVLEVSFERYLPKKITSLKLIEAPIDYSFKFADRELLNTLLVQKGNCDEILITRNGFITDTSYSNVVLSKGKQYFTPESPLLNGTKRQQLLREGIISGRAIHRDSLPEYDHIYLINAMLDIEDDICLPVLNILY